MNERPILMSAESVRAILAGRKTMTRRPIVSVLGIGRVTEFGASDTKGYDFAMRDRQMRWNELRRDDLLARCPYPIGSRLWVRETWAHNYYPGDQRTFYKADGGAHQDWKSPIFMPRWASRILLEVTENRAERLWDITEADADAEGFNGDFPDRTFPTVFTRGRDYYSQFSMSECFGILWDSINGKRYPWASNPWVWPITFKVLKAR